MVEQNKNTQLQKDIFDLSETEFIDYFKEKVVPHLNEIQVQLSSQAYTILIIVMIAIFAPQCAGSIFFLIFFIALSSFADTGNLPIWSFLLFILFSLLFTAIPIYSIVKALKARRTKNSFLSKNKLFKHLGLEYFSLRWSQHEDVRALQRVINVYEDILLYTFWLRRGIDEIIKSSYHNIPFTIIEQAPMERKYGLVLMTKINKYFKEDLWLRSSFGLGRALFMTEYQTPVYDEIVLEDVNFAKEYKICGKDQVEARYLLTPTFMERLLKYKNKKRCNIEVFFSQKYSEYGNTFFYIQTDKNMFELPIICETNVEKIAKNTYNIISEIKEILEIIDALKLDQDIGL